MRRGVDVRVLVPGENMDVPIVRQASRLQYELLLRRGIRIFGDHLAERSAGVAE